MKPLNPLLEKLKQGRAIAEKLLFGWSADNWWKKLKGLIFVGLGYLLSPLCWWNDLIINLPLAYGVGYVCSWVAPNLFIPGAIAGYWLTNIVGILLMQFGALEMIAEKEEKNLTKELFSGLVSSTAYTLIILALVQLHVLDLPDLTNNQELFSNVIPKINIK